MKFDHFNVQGQQMFVWPATYSLALAYVDQLDRSGEMGADHAARMRSALTTLETAPASERQNAFMNMASHLDELATDNPASAETLTALAGTVRELAGM